VEYYVIIKLLTIRAGECAGVGGGKRERERERERERVSK
jgi:hypothetical protein